jgi:DNA-binding NarL/FixJ family response regulator
VEPRRVLIVDDDALSCDFLSLLLVRAGFASICAGTGAEALAAADETPVALVVLDVLLPDISGYEVLDRLRARHGTALPIALLSGERVDRLDRSVGLRLGADDYFVKPVDPDEFLARVRTLVRRNAPPPCASYDLTPRELEILRMLAAGRPAAAIAEELVLSPKTVHNHVDHLLVKLGVHSRSEAVALAFRQGLV